MAPSFEEFTAEDGHETPGSRLFEELLEFRASRDASFALFETASQLTLRSNLCPESPEGTGLLNPLVTEWNKGGGGSLFSLPRMRGAEGFESPVVWDKKSEGGSTESNAVGEQHLQQQEQQEEREKHIPQDAGRERQSQGQEVRHQAQNIQLQPEEATQEQEELDTRQREVERTNVSWESHPTAVLSDGYAGQELANEKDDGEERHDWSPPAGFSEVQSQDQGSSVTMVAGTVVKGAESEANVDVCAADPPASTRLSAGAVTDKYYGSESNEAVQESEPIKQEASGGLVVRSPEESSQLAVQLPPALRLERHATAGGDDEAEQARRSSVFEASSGMATHDREIWFPTRKDLTDRSVSISALIAAASERTGTPASSTAGVQHSSSPPEKWREENRESTSFPEDKVNLAKQVLTARRTCMNKGRVDGNEGVRSRTSSMEENNRRLLSQILPISCMASPASTCSSTTSPRREGPAVSLTHAGRVITLPGIEIVSNVSTAAPTRAGSGNFTGSKLLATAERSGLIFAPSAVASHPERLLAGQPNPLGFLPPPSIGTRGIRKVLTNTRVGSEAHETIFTRQRTFQLSLPAAPANSAGLGDSAKASTHESKESDSPAETTAKAGTYGATSTGQDAAGGTSGRYTVRALPRNVSVQDGTLHGENAAAYSDTNVEPNTTINSTDMPNVTASATYPFPLPAAEEDGGLWRDAADAVFESSASLRTVCENTLGSIVPPPITSTTKLPTIDDTALRSTNPVTTKSTVQTAVSEDVAHDLCAGGNYLESPRSYRRAGREEDGIVVEVQNGVSSLGAPLITPASQETVEPHTQAPEQQKGKTDASSKPADELEDPEQHLGGPSRTPNTPHIAAETPLLAAGSYTPIHGDNEVAATPQGPSDVTLANNLGGTTSERVAGSSLGPNAGQVPSGAVFDHGALTPAPVPPANSFAIRSVQHQEASPDVFAFQKQLTASTAPREMESFVLPGPSKRVSACSNPALLSASPAPVLPTPAASEPKDTLPNKTTDHILAYFPSTSPSIHAAELCEVQRGFSTAVVRNSGKVEGCSDGFHDAPHTDLYIQHQSMDAPALGVTASALRACVPGPVPLLPRGGSDVHAYASTTHGDESGRQNLLPSKCCDGQTREVPESGASTPLVDCTRGDRQNVGNGNCRRTSPIFSHREYGLDAVAGKRNSSSPPVSTCKTKSTPPQQRTQSRAVVPRDPGALNHQPSANRSGRRTTGRGSRKPQWSKAEDAMLQKFFEVFHMKWAAISVHITASFGIPRTGKQCRERWYNHVNPAVKKGGWTPFEDAYILRRQKEMGNRWAAIAKELPGRTENAVKNRFISLSNCRGSGRSSNSRTFRGGCEARHTGRTNTVTTRASSINQNGATLPEPPQGQANISVATLGEPSQVQANSNGPNSGREDNHDRIDSRSREEPAQFSLPESVPMEDAGISVVDAALQKRHEAVEVYAAARTTGPSEIDMLVAVQEEKEVDLFEAAAADRSRRCLKSLSGGGESANLGSLCQLPQLPGALRDTSQGAPVAGAESETASFPEKLRCEARGNNPATHLSIPCDGTSLPEDTFSECRGNLAGPRIAQRVVNREEYPGATGQIAAHSTAGEKGTNVRKRHRKVTETGSSRVLKTCTKAGHAKHEVAWQQELPRRNIVQSTTDVENSRIEGRVLTSPSMVRAQSAWQEGAETLLACGNGVSKAVPVEPVLSQTPCSACVGFCTCALGNSTAMFKIDDPGQGVGSHYGGEPWSTADRTSTKLAKVQVPQQPTQLQRHLVQMRQRKPGRQGQQWTTCDVSSSDAHMQKTNTWVPHAVDVETLNTPDVSSALWGVLLAKSAAVRGHTMHHLERQNVQRVERQQGTSGQVMNLDSAPDQSHLLNDEPTGTFTHQDAETGTTQLLQPSQGSPIMNFTELKQATSFQESQKENQEMPLQHRGLQQLCLMPRHSQNTGGCLRREPADCEGTPSHTEVQRETRLLPARFSQQTSYGSQDTKLPKATLYAEFYSNQQEPREAVSRKEQEQQHFVSSTNQQQGQLTGNSKGHHLLQLQEWNGAQRRGQDDCEEEVCPQHLGGFDEQRCIARKPRGAYDCIQKEQQLIGLEGESGSSSARCTDGMRGLGAKQNFTGELGHKTDGTPKADALAQSPVSNTLQGALPANGEDKQSGQQTPQTQGQQQNPIFSCLPLEKITVRQALDLRFATNTPNDLRTSARRGWGSPTLQNEEQLNMYRCGGGKLCVDAEGKRVPHALRSLSEAQSLKRDKTVFVGCGITTPQGSPQGLNQVDCTRIGSNDVMETVYDFDQGGCGPAARSNFVEGGMLKDASCVQPTGTGEQSVFPFQQTLPQLRPPQPLEQTEDLKRLFLSQQQPQHADGANLQVTVSLENPLRSLHSCMWSGQYQQSNENVTGTASSANEDHLNYLSGRNVSATTELSSTKFCGESFAPTRKEDHGFSLNTPDAGGTTSLLHRVVGQRAAVADVIERERVAAIVQNAFEGGTAALFQGCSTERAAGHAGDSAVLATEAGKLRATLSSFQQLRPTGKAGPLQQQDLTQHEVRPLPMAEEDRSWKATYAEALGLSPYIGRISSGVPILTERVAHVTCQPSSEPPRLPAQESDDTRRTPRQAAALSRDSAKAIVVDEAKVPARHGCETFISAPPGQGFKPCFANEAEHEGTTQGPFRKLTTESLQQSSVRRLLPLTSFGAEDPSQRVQQPDPLPAEIGCREGSERPSDRDPEPGKVCLPPRSAQMEASALLTDVAASSAAALVRVDTGNQTSAGHPGPRNVYVNEKPRLDLPNQEDRQGVQAREPSEGHQEWQMSFQGAQQRLLGGRFLMAGIAAAGEESKAVSVLQQVGRQKQRLAGSEKATMQEEKFVFEDLTAEASRQHPLEDASGLSAAGEPNVEIRAPPQCVPRLC